MPFLPPHMQRAPRPDAGGDERRTAYMLASHGVLGFALWFMRAPIRALAARIVTLPVAVGAILVALALLAIASNLHIRLLSVVAGWSLLIIPLVWLMGWLRRTKEAAWAAEHGSDSDAFRRALEDDERAQDRAITKDDWLIDPPWKRAPQSQDRRPRFGRK